MGAGMTTQCEHTFQSINEMQSVCVRCDYVLTIGDGKC